MSPEAIALNPTTEGPVSPTALVRARALVQEYPHCFVAWPRSPEISTREDVKEVIHELRAYGGHRAWKSAQELLLCL